MRRAASLDAHGQPPDLGPATEAAIQVLIASKGFCPRDDVLRVGVASLWDQLGDDNDGPLTPEERAGVERGLADVRAGRVHTAAQVREELERRHAARW